MSSKNNHLISIIIPVYNAEKYLAECLDSVISQTYRNIEIIIINDSSTDNSRKIIDKYTKQNNHINVIQQKKNHGVSVARNLGIKHAKGDYIMFIDADDWISKLAVETLVKSINTQTDIVFSPYIKCTRKRHQIKANINNPFTMPVMGNTCYGKLYKASLFQNQRFNEKLTKAEDIELNFRIFRPNLNFLYVDQALYYYRIHTDSAVREYNPKAKAEYIETFNTVRANLSNNSDEELLGALYDFTGIIYLIILLNTVYHPKNKNAKKPQLLALEKENLTQTLFQHTKQLQLPITNRIAISLAKYHLFTILRLLVFLKRYTDA